jgi:hypothetical protein
MYVVSVELWDRDGAIGMAPTGGPSGDGTGKKRCGTEVALGDGGNRSADSGIVAEIWHISIHVMG